MIVIVIAWLSHKPQGKNRRKHQPHSWGVDSFFFFALLSWGGKSSQSSALLILSPYSPYSAYLVNQLRNNVPRVEPAN